MITITKNQFVVNHNGKWAVKSANAKRATKVFSKQSDARNFAIGIAKKQHSEVIGQGKNGKINFKNSYGNDPRNIKG